jgi:signal transduction histidine kinase
MKDLQLASEATEAQAELSRENARLRGDLLTIAHRISHDLRTPLGGVITTGEALKEMLQESDPSLLPMAESLLESAEQLSKLIQRVSFILKASANPRPKERMNMGDAVARVLQQLESRILKKNARVSQPETWPDVEAIASSVEVIWWNLLANALEHAGEAPQIELGWRNEGEQFHFWISDSGPGVSETARPKLFQPFEALHQSNSSRGLGLSLVQRLVELQGGTCNYEPGAAGGSVFSFSLP